MVAQNITLVTFKTKYTATNKKNFVRHKYRKVSKLTFPTKEEQNLNKLFLGPAGGGGGVVFTRKPGKPRG